VDSNDLIDPTLGEYYARRAAEYEEIYEKPERQSDLAALKEHVKSLLQGHRILEVACGTGYWTQLLAPVCRSMVAIDASPETLKMARGKSYGEHSVRFQVADAYDLEDVEGDFTAGFAGFWWSHIPRERLGSFLHGFHSKLKPGALVCFVDNRYVEGSSTPVAGTDEKGNTFQRRLLKDGSLFDVVKNFPTSKELGSAVASWTGISEIKVLRHYWCLSYRLKEPAVTPDKGETQ
jgi:demethylmenaquinone methyltransferase/2-methoxy-6-polyprenyl-1,4-benzoquinol methylase